MHIRTICGAGFAALTVAALLAARVDAAEGSATVFETGVGKLTDLSWNGGDECQVVQLAPPPDSMNSTREIQVISDIRLGGFFSDNCAKTTTGGVLNGPDFYVTGGMALVYPGPVASVDRFASAAIAVRR